MTVAGKNRARAFDDATESLERFNLAWKKGAKLDKLRRRAERFDTPNWQRPFHRLRVRYFLFRHYRHVNRSTGEKT